MNDTSAEDEQSNVASRTDRLRQAIADSGGPAIVSRRSKIPATTISNYLSGRDMKASALVALAEACRVSVDWLATGRPASMSQMQSLDSALGFTAEHLGAPAHYWAILALTLTAQEFYERADQHGTLAQVLGWVAANYANALPLPDRRVKLEFVDDKGTEEEAA